MSEFSNMPLTETNLRALIQDEVGSKKAVWSETKGSYLVENYNPGAGNLTAKKIICDEIEVKYQPHMLFLNPGEAHTLFLQSGAITIIARDVPLAPQPMLSVDSSAAWPMAFGFFIVLFVKWVSRTYQRGCEIAKLEESIREKH